MKNETDRQITEYFNKSDIPPINEKTIERLKEKTENLKTSNVSFSFKKLAIAITCVAVVLISILIPVLNNINVVYYSDTETNEQPISIEYAQELILEGYSKYSFIFEDFAIIKIDGIYSNDENKLLGIRIRGENYNVPFSTLNVCLAINKNFTPREREGHIYDAVQEQQPDYILYKKIENTFVDTIIYGIMDHNTYSLYIKINKGDYNTFNKFL